MAVRQDTDPLLRRRGFLVRRNGLRNQSGPPGFEFCLNLLLGVCLCTVSLFNLSVCQLPLKVIKNCVFFIGLL